MNQNQPFTIDINSMMTFMLYMMVMVMLMRMMNKALEEPKERSFLIGGAKLPAGYVPVREYRRTTTEKPPKAPPRITEEEELQEKKLSLENTGREIARQAGVEFVRLEDGWEAKYATPIYWFKDAKGNKIRAFDLEELKEKLSLIAREHHSSGNVEQKIRFIGSCKVSEGMCLTHGYSVSEIEKCPKSELTDGEWKAAWELAGFAFPEGQHNPWVNGWWPNTIDEAERTVKRYEVSLWDAYRKYEAQFRKAVELYRRSTEKMVRSYRQYVMSEYRRGKELARA